jgi:hypothetical protein
MIAPVNVIPPVLSSVNTQSINKKDVNPHLQPFSLDNNIAVASANVETAWSLDDSADVNNAETNSVLDTTVSATNSINALFDRAPAPQLMAEVTADKTIAEPGFITPTNNNSFLPVANDLPASQDNFSTDQLSAAPPPSREPAPLPPPSEVSPPIPAPPPLPSPIPTGPPPVEPGNYAPSQAQNLYYNQNYIGPAISFGSSTQIGAVSRFGLAKNISIRPSLFLGSSPQVSVPVTYDFGLNTNEQFERNPLLLLHAGGGLSYRSVTGGNSLNPLVVLGADLYFGDGASVLVQLANTFNSDFSGIVGVGLQF